MIAEAELASEAARPKPRRNRSSGLMFVLKTSPWRPGDLSWAKMRNGLQKYQCQEPHTQNKMANHQPFSRKATQTIYRFAEMLYSKCISTRRFAEIPMPRAAHHRIVISLFSYTFCRKGRQFAIRVQEMMYTICTPYAFPQNVYEQNVGRLFGLPSTPYVSWQGYHVAAVPGRKRYENSMDFRRSRQGGACNKHTT